MSSPTPESTTSSPSSATSSRTSVRTRLDPERRRREILETARQHFAKRPFGEVAVTHVAKDAGVSVGLVHKYFDSKNGLFAAVLRSWLEEIATRQEHELAQLQSGQSSQDHVVAFLHGYLTGIANLPGSHAREHVLHGHDDRDAQRVRAEFGSWGVDKLGALVRPNNSARDRYALTAAMGAAQAGARAWAERGCPEAELHPLIDALVGCLHGALGDWQR